MSDIVTQTLSHPPVDTTLVAGRWHRGMVSPYGVWTEAKVLVSALTRASNPDIHKFLIISRARSGSTLLTRLLNDHPDVRCGRELLARRVLSPVRYLNNLALKSPTAAYGSKLLSYQMVQVQRFADPVEFLQQLADTGFRFIHLERNTFSQTLSLAMAQSTKTFHQHTNAAKGPQPAQAPKDIDIEDFIRRLKWNDLLLRYEHHCLEGFKPFHVSYEDHLHDGAKQQATADLIFDWIGVPSAPVQSGLRKILPPDPSRTIANYEALASAITAQGLGHLLPVETGQTHT